MADGEWCTGPRYRCVSYDLVDDFYYGNDHPAGSDAFSLLHLLPPRLHPNPFYYCAHVDGCPFPFHPRSLAKLDLRFPIDLEVFTTPPIAIISAGQLFYDNRRRLEETRWIADPLRSSYRPFWPFPAFVGDPPSCVALFSDQPRRIRGTYVHGDASDVNFSN